jgi:hypothetical protein
MDTRLYQRYHTSVYLPDTIREAAEAFLPLKGTPLVFSDHYQRIQAERRLPRSIYMPYTYSIIDVTTIRATGGIVRVLIRSPWNRRVDIAVVLEGDFEVVTAFYASPRDEHQTLDVSVYEPVPVSEGEQKVLDALADEEFIAAGVAAYREGRTRPWSEVKAELCIDDEAAGEEEQRRQSRPDDST